MADSADRYPLVSLDGRLDSDGDGIPNICDNSCLNRGMTAEYQVSVGGFAACALDDNGVQCWGSNAFGQLDVSDLLNPVQVSMGFTHACAIDDNGVKCWGDNDDLQTITVPPLVNPFKVVAGSDITCAIDDNGMKCWGRALGGVTDVPSLSNPVQIGLGNIHACAVSDSEVTCWGNNSGGRATVPTLSLPTQVSAGGNGHSCSIDSLGIQCWGDNDFGQVSVPALSNPRQVSAGAEHSCAIDDNGIKCWGNSSDGRIAVPELSNPVHVDAGFRNTCAIDDNGVKCWGRKSFNGITEVPLLTMDIDGDGLNDHSGVGLWIAPIDNIVAVEPDYDLDLKFKVANSFSFDIDSFTLILESTDAIITNIQAESKSVACSSSSSSPPPRTRATCSISSLAASSEAELTITVASSDFSPITINATVSSSATDSNTGDNTATVTMILGENLDFDSDGFIGNQDALPYNSSEWRDSDGDGIGDNADVFPLDSRFSTNSAPTIELLNESGLTLTIGDTFTAPRVSARDLEDGDLTASVVTVDDVDTSVVGTYTLEYLVTDSLGKTTSITRNVQVIAFVACTNSITGATRLQPGQFLELPIRGTCLSSPAGDSLTVPSNATAASLNVTAVTPGAAGFVTVYPCGVARPNASNLNFVAGDVVPNGVVAPIGSNGSVCLYSSHATDLIVDVSGWFEGEAFVGATPQRLVDTRDGTGGQLGQLIAEAPLVTQTTGISATTAAGSATTIPTTTAAGSATTIPTTAGTVALNVTVVNPDSPGFITVYPCDAPRPLASNLNYVAGQVVANGVLAPVSSSGQVCLYSQSPTDIIVDLAGWFPGNAFTGATPSRLVDTRDGTGAPLAKLTPSGQLSVAVQGAILSVNGNSAQVPLQASAAALNVTVVNPESGGFVTVWPCSAERPNASNLNFTAGMVVANNVVAPIGDQGNVCFFASQNTDIIVDISGYFTGENGNQFVGSTPKRFVDTRDGTGPAPQ